VPGPEDADADPGEPDREVNDAECDNHLPGDLIRDEGDDPAGGDQEANQVYDNLGSVFDYYSTTFGRDSYDNAGGDLIASINFCETPGTPMHNAYWNGTQMVCGDGYASSLDVTAHELTHAVTEETAGLEYQCQSGALNESMSDTFASNVDDDDWQIGEDPGVPGLR
jgi:bacillolysin